MMTTTYGRNVKPEKARKWLREFAAELVPGEEVWFYGKCNNLRPAMNALMVTNARVLGLSEVYGYRWRATHTDIAEAAGDAKRHRLTVRTEGGSEVVFKAVDAQDIPVALDFIAQGRGCDLPPDL